MHPMINDDIIAIKDNILNTVGDDCEKIILFSSYANGTPNKDSDYDFYVVLKDGTAKPVFVLQKIYQQMRIPRSVPVDVLANYKSNFERLCVLPAIKRTIAQTGVTMYEK
jgi:predicted nucleotidyltransferase